MKTQKVVSFFLILACLCSLSMAALADTSLTSTDYLDVASHVSAQSFVLMDANTLEVLGSAKEEVRLPMASTTKLMTALVALKYGDLESTVTITNEAVGVEGSSIYLYAGEKLTLSELLYGLLLESANDAAVAIAIHVGGSMEKFVELMNQEAVVMGLKNTHFTNPHGLHNDEHYSTAYEMGVIIAIGLNNEEFVRIISTKNCKITQKDDGYRYLSNHNRLLGSYDGYVGGKTGYTTTAGRCLVSAAYRNGATLIAVTLNDPNDWADHRSLLDYGFSQYETFVLAEEKSIQIEVPVVGGVISQTVLTNRDSIKATLRDDEGIVCVIEAQPFLYAPIIGTDGGSQSVNGEAIVVNPVYGEAVYYQNNREVTRVSLYAASSVDRYEEVIELTFWQKLWNAIKSIF